MWLDVLLHSWFLYAELANRRGQGWALHHLPWQLWQRLYSWRLDRQLLEIYSQTRERGPQAKWIPHPHKDHRCCQSSSMFTPNAWQIWTKMDSARLSQWQITGSHTKHQGTPRRQLKQCNNWIVYPSGVMTPNLSSVQTQHKHCGAHLTTEQQSYQCQ